MADIQLLMHRHGYPEETHFAFSYTPVHDATGAIAGFFCPCQDITAQVFGQRHRAALLALDDQLRDVVETADISFSASKLLGKTVGAVRVGYGVLDSEAKTIQVERNWSAPGFADVAGLHRFDDYGTYIDELLRGQAVANVDVERDPRTAANVTSFQALGIRAHLDVPVIENGRPVAQVFVHSSAPRAWTEEEITFVRDLAERTRVAIARRLAENALRASEMRQAFLLSLSDELRLLSDPAEITSAAARRLGEQFNLSRVFYAEFHGSCMSISRDYTRGVGSIVGDHDLAAFGADLLGSYHECPVVKVENVATDERLGEEARAELRARQVGAYLDVVLFENEQSVSLLAFQSATPRQWTSAEEGLLRDVAERVKGAIARGQAEAALRDLNDTLETQIAERTAELRRYRDIVDATAAPICAFDKDYRLTAFNKAHAEEFRRINGSDSQLGETFPDLFIAEQAEVMRSLMTRALAGEAFTVVEEFGRPELGAPSWEITYTPLRDEMGQVVGAFHHAVDISERLAAEAELVTAQEALRQSQKLESMGQLTGGVAHDINNLLTPIMGSLDLLSHQQLGNARQQRMISGALQAAERAKVLVQRLLAFARRQPLQPVAVDVAALLAGMGELIDTTTGPRVRVGLDLAPNLPAAIADANQLELAILNLAVNASDAMPDGGTLTISAKHETTSSGRPLVLSGSDYLRLSVIDTGTGMDEATLTRAVEPFFSTKGVGRGTGLGLSMVHGLAAQLGGALVVSSQPSHGTTVDLWLPISPDAVLESGAAVRERSSKFAGTALLVDDEELVRLSTADMLHDLGYEVVEAGSAEEALRLIDQGLVFDLLVTDHLMSGITGTELVRTLQNQLPNVAALIVSGYAEVEGVAPDLPRLTKPYMRDDLAAVILELTAKR
jgi:PAS domain S-box-containing protein